MSIIKKAAEILVECGYADKWDYREPDTWIHYCQRITQEHWRLIQFTNDTLEGRRQADAIEDWLYINAMVTWFESVKYQGKRLTNKTLHQSRIDRIKWCLEQLIKTEEK